MNLLSKALGSEPCLRRATCKALSWSDGLVFCNQLAPALKTWSLPDLFQVEPGDQDLISSDISPTDQFHPASPGAPDLSLFGIPVLAGRLAFAALSGRRLVGAPLVAEHTAQGLPRAATNPGTGPLRPPVVGRWPTTGADAGASEGGGLSPLCLQMALGLLKEDFFFFTKGKRLLLCTSLKPK